MWAVRSYPPRGAWNTTRQYVESNFIPGLRGGPGSGVRCGVRGRSLAHAALGLQSLLLQRAHQVAHKLHLGSHLRGQRVIAVLQAT